MRHLLRPVQDFAGMNAVSLNRKRTRCFDVNASVLFIIRIFNELSWLRLWRFKGIL